VTELIRQREKSDCAICTIAMALGLAYEDVLEAALLAKAYEPGVGCRSEYTIIERFGFRQMIDFRIHHRTLLDAKYFLHFSWGRRAILAVPSLNIEGGFHSVYWTGTELRDPCTLKTYSSWEDLRPDEIIIFAEAGISREGFKR
jgi:hypothetical protein